LLGSIAFVELHVNGIVNERQEPRRLLDARGG